MQISNEILINNFINKIRSEDGLAKNTIISYKKDLELLSFFLSNKSISFIDLKKYDFLNYLEFIDKQKLKINSILRKLSCFRHFFNFLEIENFITESPIKNISAPKKNKNLPKFLTESEINIILDGLALDNSEYGVKMSCMVEMLYSSGLRVSELTNLPISSIQFKGNEIDNFLIIKGKGNKERMVPINESAKKSLNKYLILRKNLGLDYSNWLFLGNVRSNKNKIRNKKYNLDLLLKHDKPISRQGFHKMLKELARRFNINPARIHPHVFRHSFATHLINRGADLRMIQELLGHNDISTTEIYTNISENKLKDAVFNNHPLINFIK